MKGQLDHIEAEIIRNCSSRHGLTAHGGWLVGLLGEVSRGETPLVPVEDKGLNFFGLERFVRFMPD